MPSKEYYREYRRKRRLAGLPVGAGKRKSAEYYREYRARRQAAGNPVGAKRSPATQPDPK